MYSRIVISFLSIVGLVILPACGPKYQKRPLKPLTKKTADFYESKNGIEVMAKKLDTLESSYLFNNRLHESIRPIQVTLNNATSYQHTVTLHETTVKSLTFDQMYQLMRFYPFYRFGATFGTGLAIGVATAGALILAVHIGGHGGGGSLICSLAFVIFAYLIGLGIIIIALGSGLIAAIYQGSRAQRVNKDVAHDLEEKMFGEEQILNPYASMDKVVFIKDEAYNAKLLVTNDENRPGTTFAISFNE